MMKKPIVILSCDIDEEQRLRQRQEYFQAVADAGGIPVVMPPFVERSKIEEWLDAVAADALLLTGGADIDVRCHSRSWEGYHSKGMCMKRSCLMPPCVASSR